jgi:hypothetical protein
MLKSFIQTTLSIVVVFTAYTALAASGGVYVEQSHVETVSDECADLEALQARLDKEYSALKSYEIQAEEYCEIK